MYFRQQTGPETNVRWINVSVNTIITLVLTEFRVASNIYSSLFNFADGTKKNDGGVSGGDSGVGNSSGPSIVPRSELESCRWRLVLDMS